METTTQKKRKGKAGCAGSGQKLGWIGIGLLFALAAGLSCASFLFYVQLSTQNEDLIGLSQSLLQRIEDLEHQMLKLQYSASYVDFFPKDGKQKRQKRETSHSDNQSSLLPASHLILDGKLTNEANLVWTASLTSSHIPNNAVWLDYDGKILIPSSGTYFIYSQLTFRGKKHIASDPTCAYQVVLTCAQTELEENLMYSGTTQINAGRRLYVDRHGNNIHAEDSVYVGGVFMLTAGDKLQLKLDDLSRTCRVSDVTEKTFFGVVKLSLA